MLPLIAALSRPETYPHRPASVTLIQTHISYVFIAGDEVYKLKKPVRFSFLDFSTLPLRRKFCLEEVRLNQRLAGDTYRGVVSICSDGERFRFGSVDDQAAVEYAVHMRRLPAERTLDRLLAANQASPELIDAIAKRLAEFHRDATTNAEITANAAPEGVWSILQDNYNNARRFRGATIAAADDDAIQAFARAFLDRNDALLHHRQASGRIRDCHGDLHSDHICCTEPLVIFDCIEFNTWFRYCDVASDLAFLAMDLDFYQHPDLATHLVERYVAYSGDTELRRLMPFYQCYRAYVRGKVDSLKSIEPEVAPAEQASAADSARRHFQLAYRYTWSDNPRLVVVAGLSGTGKSSVASALSERTGFVHINSDIVRKELAGVAPTTRGGAAAGLYSDARSARTYDAMLAAATSHLASGRGVILDGTFQLRRGRDAVRVIAATHRVPVLFVECRCNEEVIRERLAERGARDDSPSDADWNIYLQQRRQAEAFAPDEGSDHLRINTAAPAAEVLAEIETALRARICI